MNHARWVSALALAAVATTAAAADGLKVTSADAFWSGVRANIRLNATLAAATPPLGLQAWPDAGAQPAGAAIVGDYYFSAAGPDERQPRTGFRASSALLIRQPGVSLSELAWSSRGAASFGIPSRVSLSSVSAGFADASDRVITQPYLGIGYSGMLPKSGWGYWADIGMVVQNPGGVFGLGRAQGFDDVLRELRLAPLVQVGVNYSF